jgi:tol-pal system protein YbgF
MYKTCGLLLVSMVAVALMAPSAPSQSRKITLEEVATDVINLQSYVKQMQETADKKNLETKALLEQILARFSTIDSSVHNLGGALGSIKTADEKSAKDIEGAKAELAAIRTSVESIRQLNLDESLNKMNLQIAGIKKQIDDIQNTPTTTGPTPREAFNTAYLEIQQGFYDLAISDLKDFLNTYPRDSRAPSAQLQIGNAYLAKKEFDKAVVAYDEAIQKYPDSDTKCTALYKKGLTLDQQKQTSEANKIFQSVAKDCANTDEGPLAAGQLKRTPARGGRGNN